MYFKLKPFAFPTGFLEHKPWYPSWGAAKHKLNKPQDINTFFIFSYAIFNLHYKKGGETCLDNDSAGCHIKFLPSSHYLQDDISICCAANLATWHLGAGAKEHYTH